MKKQTTTTKPMPRLPRRRGYQRGFTPKRGSRARSFKVDKVPATFHSAVNAKARREGVSVRGLILTLVQDWLSKEPKEMVR